MVYIHIYNYTTVFIQLFAYIEKNWTICIIIPMNSDREGKMNLGIMGKIRK